VGRSDRRDPFFKGLDLRPRLTLPPSQIAALRALIWVKAGGYAFAWLPLVMLVFGEPPTLNALRARHV
jgi:hypothetical protein